MNLLLSNLEKSNQSLRRLSDNPPNACYCHSEPFGKLGTGSAKRVIVILSNAKDLEILRLTPQNDVVRQPPRSHFVECSGRV
jgi:hypothetical protein